MKVHEARCSRCYAKIVQTGRGRRATMCAGCRKRRQDEWRNGKKKETKQPDKRIDVVGGDNT